MKKLLVAFLILFIVGCSFNDFIPKPKSDICEITCGGETMLKRIGEEFDVKVSVENATEVIGLNAWITYDPAVVEVVDETPGGDTNPVVSDLGFLSNAQLLVSIQKDGGGVEQPGTLVCGYVSIPPNPVSGDGDCFQVRFKAIGTGQTDIDFAVGHLNLQDDDGDIPTDSVGDIVDVPVNATVRITVLP